MSEISYKISINPSKFGGYQSKSGRKGEITVFISEIWKNNPTVETLLLGIIDAFISERICVERAFQRIKIKGGMCNPCCIKNVANEMFQFVLEQMEM